MHAFLPTRLLAAVAVVALPSAGHAQDAPEPAETEEEAGEIVVQATRSGRRVRDEPIRVEVIDREEIEEKITMSPGNIAMVVAETGGLRVQVTSPGLGAANVRVRGLEGRYTLLLSDGLPLYGQASSIGLLQIPPTDLGRVEVIKGAASALYGSSALGGVINLVSRRPDSEPVFELLANATSRNGHDLTAYAASARGDTLGYSLTGGYHRQTAQDLDEDGWADMPGYARVTARPRLFWERADGAKAYLTLGAMHETRTGGTLPGRVVPDGRPFVEAQRSTRIDTGLTGEVPLAGIGTLHLRASGMTQRFRHRFGDVVEKDRHSSLFGELSLSGNSDGTSWLAGLAYQLDDFRSETFASLDYNYRVPAIFGQIEQDVANDVVIAGSARADFHSDYGTRLSPRASILFRPERLTVRASLGRGFFAPTPFVEEIEATGLDRLQPLAALTAETANTASLDLGYTIGMTELNGSIFAAHVDNALRLEPVAGGAGVRIGNAPGQTRTRGIELLARHRLGAVTLTASYVHIHSTEPDPTSIDRREVPRTPRDSAGIVAIWEKHGRARIGFEAYYTGRQELDDNPYRTLSRPYVEMGLLGELTFGRAKLFLNLENLLDVRQTRYDPLLRRQRAADGRWTVDVWGPTEGFVVNGGVRLRFGGN